MERLRIAPIAGEHSAINALVLVVQRSQMNMICPEHRNAFGRYFRSAARQRFHLFDDLRKDRMRGTEIIAVLFLVIGQSQQSVDGFPQVGLRNVNRGVRGVVERLGINRQSARLLYFDGIDTRYPLETGERDRSRRHHAGV